MSSVSHSTKPHLNKYKLRDDHHIAWISIAYYCLQLFVLFIANYSALPSQNRVYLADQPTTPGSRHESHPRRLKSLVDKLEHVKGNDPSLTTLVATRGFQVLGITDWQ